MKRLSLFLFVCILLLTSKTTLAQTASDYYLPLIVGSHVTLHSVGADQFSARTTINTIEGTDLISGQQYFREVGREIMDYDHSSDIFQVFWLRKDPVGNVAWGAMSEESTDIDSATIFNPAVLFFPNQYLTPGYSRDYSMIGMPNGRDSVMSITETVTVHAGTFTNCIKICQTRVDNLGNVIRREYSYYAKGIGVVKYIKDIPVDQQGTGELIEYGITGVGDDAVNQIPRNYSLSQNYPNPFNPVTNIKYSIAKEGNVKLTVYNAIGSKVVTIVNEYKPAGSYSIQFDGSNLASGIYLYRLESENYSAAKKFILMK
jgi:hypothetical protein